jgi:hypothetical protein
MESREDGRGWDGRITKQITNKLERAKPGCAPQGRRTRAKRPNVLLIAGILSQSVAGGYDRQMFHLTGGVRSGQAPRGWNGVR